MQDDEDRTRTRFLVGCLVVVSILGCIGVVLWTPLPGLVVMLWQ